MKNTLLTLVLLLGGSLFLPLSQAEEWPYGSSGFDQSDDDEEGYPPESMPDLDEDEDDIYDEDPDDDDSDFDSSDNSTWSDTDDE